MELFISNVGLATFGPMFGHKMFYEWTDNKVALALMRSLNPSSDDNTRRLQLLVQWRVRLLRSNSWRSAAERVSSKNNKWADLGSRGEIAQVVDEAVALGLHSVECSLAPSVVEFRDTWI